jgi:WD40 repeat protein/serine/threonine protein kinase
MAASGIQEQVSLESLVGQVADEFLQRQERGERPDVQEYAARYPEAAPVLRKVLAGLALLERSLADAALPGTNDENPLTGTLGDFRILREVGRGGMGVVYEAEQISLGRRVALKVLPFAATLDPKQLQRFKIEAQAAAHLHHQNTVPVYGVGCERGVHYYAMQYIEGQTLAALIRELRQLAGLEAPDPSGSAAVVSPCCSEQPTGPNPTTTPPHHDTPSRSLDATPPVGALSTERSANSPAFFRTVAHLGVQAAEALEHAHAKGIIHRDIKPANLLVDVSGNLWITDFGLARMLSEAGLTMTGDLLGTLRYMSPEQALAKRVPVDHRTDIYSLGVTLYELLTLRPACNGRDRQEVLQQITFEEPRPPRRLNKAVPTELETIVRKAMGKNPAERYATAQELADDLRRFLDHKPIRAKKPTLWDWTRKWARRHQGVVTTAIAGLIIALGILTVSMLLILSAYRSEAKQHQTALKEGQSAVTALYRSLVREAEAIRRARGDGYRSKAWQRLRDALQLDTPEKDLNQLRQDAVACMGDFVGLDPVTWNDFPADVIAIALHPKGELLAIGLNNGMVLLWDLATGKATAQFQRHSSPVTGLAFAPDGVRLVSAEWNGTIHIWEKVNGDWTLGRTIGTEPRHVALIPSASYPFFMPYFNFARINSIAITPDAKNLAAALGFRGAGSECLPSTIALWNLADGTRSRNFDSGRRLEWTRAPALSPDGKFLAACYLRYIGASVSLKAQEGVLVWDLDRFSGPRDLTPDLGFVYKAEFSPDGKLLACGCGEGIALFDTSKFQRQPFAPAQRSSLVAFSPDSHLLAIANELLGQVRLWNVTSNREIAVVEHPGEFRNSVYSLALGQATLVTASRRAVRKWNLAGSGEKLILTGHGKGVDNLAFSPDGKLLASTGKDRMVKIWDAITGQFLYALTGFGADVETVAFGADGKTLAAGDWAGSIQICDVPSGRKLAALTDHGLGRRIWSVAFSPNGQYFAACGGGWYSGAKRGVALWRIEHGATHRDADVDLKFQAIPGPVESAATFICFSPDSRWLAWADNRNDVRVWDLEEFREKDFPRVRLAGFYNCLAFQPGSKNLCFVADGGGAEAWDVETGRKVFSIGAQESNEKGGSARLHCLIAMSADGSRLAGICGRNVTIWDTARRRLWLRLPEEHGVIYSIAWSPNRDFLALGTGDGEMAIWNLARIKAQLDEVGLGW